MSKRNRAYRGYDTAYLLGPVSPSTLAALPSAVRRLAAADHMGMVGRPWPTADARAGDRDGVLTLPDDLGDMEVIARLRAADYPGRPLAVAVAGERLAVLVPHEVADGVESMALLQSLLVTAATGEPPHRDPPLRFPVLRAARSAGFGAFRAFLHERRARPRVQASMVDAAPPRLATVTLTDDRLQAVRRGRSTGGRATLATRLASVTISAMSAVARSDRTAELIVPFDLRYAAGGRVAGNFVHGEVLGSLDQDWTPGAINAALAAKRRTLVPSMVWRLVRPRRRRAQSRTASAGTERLSGVVSMLSIPALPDAVWAPGPVAERRFTCISLSGGADLLAVVATSSEAAYISLVDGVGWLDVDRFAAALQQEIDTRLGSG